VISVKSQKEITEKIRNAVIMIARNLRKSGLRLSLSKTDIVVLHGKELMKYKPPILNLNVGMAYKQI
jgi:hypothetical protein